MTGREHIVEQGREILKLIAAVENNVRVYPPKHPAILEPAEQVCGMLKPLFSGRAEITFGIVNSEIYFERQLLGEESIRRAKLIELLMRSEVNSLSFAPDVTPESIATFFSLVGGKNDAGLDGESLRAKLRESGATGISFQELVTLDIPIEADDFKDMPLAGAKARRSYGGALACIEAVGADILGQRSIDTRSVDDTMHSLMSDFLTDKKAIMGLLNIKDYSEHLFHHSVNVAITCLFFAKKLRLPEPLAKAVGIGGLLHDMGKLKIPNEILDKPGRLTEMELSMIERHPMEGARMLMQLDGVGELSVVAAMEHHARQDLRGYPEIIGKKIPHPIARIVMIADVYEAMTADRTYRKACSVHDTMGYILSRSGTYFDPLLVKLFFDSVGVFPPGSYVRIRSGQTALVTDINEGDPFHPKVRPIDPTTGIPSEKVLLDTAADPARFGVIGIADCPKI